MNNKNHLWLRWTAANGISELIGLGTTFLIIGLLVSKIGTQSVAGILLAFAMTVASGAVEATIVGLAQWWAMRPRFPQVTRFGWWRATLIGALVGYAFGYLPSTLMSMNEAAIGPAPAEPPQWLTLLLAAGLGSVAGAVMSFAQWLVLRGKHSRAGLWIPANMLAWACGMPIIFEGIDLAFKVSQPWLSVLIAAIGILVAGLVVGAIHARFLVRIAESQALPGAV
jgi:hypothetical protein